MAVFLEDLSQQIEVMNHLREFDTFFSAANSTAVDIRDESWYGNLGARALSLVQVIMSIVAIPFSLIAMIFTPAIMVCVHGPMVAKTWASGFGSIAGAHLFQIFASLVGVIFPSTLRSAGVGPGMGAALRGGMQAVAGMMGAQRQQPMGDPNFPQGFETFRMLFGNQ